jgi:hypothetical protein
MIPKNVKEKMEAAQFFGWVSTGLSEGLISADRVHVYSALIILFHQK